jgi:hypothetical protein
MLVMRHFCLSFFLILEFVSKIWNLPEKLRILNFRIILDFFPQEFCIISNNSGAVSHNLTEILEKYDSIPAVKFGDY